MSSRNLQIDALRGLAALSVMLFHFTSWYGKSPVDGILRLNNFLSPPLLAFYFGDIGVPLFFMISGYVITASSERHSKVTSFACSRFARLYPLYWCSIIFAVACYLPSNHRLIDYQPEWLTIAVNFSMFQTGVGVNNVNEAYWTLYIELQFYVLIALAIATKQTARIPLYTLFLSAAYACATLLNFWDWVPGLWRIKANLPLVLFANYFSLGIWVRTLRTSEQHKARNYTAIAICCVCLFINPEYNPLASLLVLLVFWLACEQKLKVLENRVFVGLGSISYALYLFHGPCGYTMFNYLQGFVQIDLLITAAVCTSIAVAFLFSIALDKPIQRFLKRIKIKQMPSHDSVGRSRNKMGH
jgi:peptidoglycan/LPS O-acetylase OafA/YrhL